MKSARLILVAPIALLTALALPGQLAAQHARYKLIDLGTFGGPASSFNAGGRMLNSRGFGVGASETATPDPPDANGFPCGPGTFVYHAFEWRHGAITDLGALPGTNNCSNAGAINARGDIAGNSEIHKIDPVLGIKEIRAVLWKHGQITDLGTLGGNHSTAGDLNSRDQVVGFSLNTVADPLSLFFGPTQTRAFLWQHGVMHDLGTLGGPDAIALLINEPGQVTGISFTNSVPNATTGMPTVDPFFWDNGTMTDIGTLGGTFAVPGSLNNAGVALNNRGQVAGTSNLAGDQTWHPFLWDRGELTDLGTFGGSTGQATGINDAGEVVGEADFPDDQVHDAFLWKNGIMNDLGNLGQTSFAFGINNRGQVVGHSLLDDGTFHAFLWENGGPMIDLNSLIPAGSGLVLRDALAINDQGEIAGAGLPPGCENAGDPPDPCGHAYVLVPVSHDETQSTPSHLATGTRISSQVRPTAREMIDAWRSRLARFYHLRGRAIPID